MALSLTRLVPGRTRPGRIGTCLVCHEPVRDDDERTHLRGGGLVHWDCATYRMRRRDGRTFRRPSPGGNDAFTGE